MVILCQPVLCHERPAADACKINLKKFFTSRAFFKSERCRSNHVEFWTDVCVIRIIGCRQIFLLFRRLIFVEERCWKIVFGKFFADGFWDGAANFLRGCKNFLASCWRCSTDTDGCTWWGKLKNGMLHHSLTRGNYTTSSQQNIFKHLEKWT